MPEAGAAAAAAASNLCFTTADGLPYWKSTLVVGVGEPLLRLGGVDKCRRGASGPFQGP
jgi:hypothetical protein